MAASVIANDGQDIIFQKIELDPTSSFSFDNIEEDFEIESTIDWIREGDFSRIGLQFPNELLPKAVAIAMMLEKRSGKQCAILGDTSFGSCCVDEVAAEHYNINALVHYGRACLSSRPRSLPVKFVFGRRPLLPSLDAALAAVTASIPAASHRQLIVIYDLPLSQSVGEELMELLCNCAGYQEVVISVPDLETDDIKKLECLRRCGRRFPSLSSNADLAPYTLLYVGSQGLALHNILLSFPSCQAAFSLDPGTCTLNEESPATNRLVKRRLHLIERARDAQRVGILVGTLAGRDYISVIDRAGEQARRAGKAVYTFVVGKLNVAKLANFPEMDVFVLVACPECALLSSREFYRPMITPFEFQVACSSTRHWTGDIFVDFRDLLPGGRGFAQLSEAEGNSTQTEGGEDDDHEGDVSLITGAVRTTYRPPIVKPTSDSWSLQERPQEAWSVARLQQDRGVWRGLEPRLGETPVVPIVEGRRGIAIGYEEEGQPRPGDQTP